MKKYILKIAHRGYADAPAFCKPEPPENSETLKTADKEGLKLSEAVEALKEELSNTLIHTAAENRVLFEAELLLLGDPAFTDPAFELIKQKGLSAVDAMKLAGKTHTDMLSESDDPYIKSRIDDINGLIDSIVRILRGEKSLQPEIPSVLVARELSPVFLSSMDNDLICGIITCKGSPLSHLSIMAQNSGIPYIYGSLEAFNDIKTGDRLLIDGETLIIEPDKETLTQISGEKDHAGSKSGGRLRPDKLCAGGKPVVFHANAGSLKDIEAAQKNGAAGIGLLRTEFLFLNRAAEPSEEEQFELYKKAAVIMGEKELKIRTMDLGYDKRPLWLCNTDVYNNIDGISQSITVADHIDTTLLGNDHTGKFPDGTGHNGDVTKDHDLNRDLTEDYDCSGDLPADYGQNYDLTVDHDLKNARGISLSLKNETFFRKQLRAILRAAVFGNIKIILPMVTSVDEVDRTLKLISDCESELKAAGIPYKTPDVGIMAETFEAVDIISELAERSAFFSIGTNDLIRAYHDRQQQHSCLNPTINDNSTNIYRDQIRNDFPIPKPVLEAVGKICRAAHDHHISVSVCGQLACNETAIPLLLKAGVDELSVPAEKLPKT